MWRKGLRGSCWVHPWPDRAEARQAGPNLDPLIHKASSYPVFQNNRVSWVLIWVQTLAQLVVWSGGG